MSKSQSESMDRLLEIGFKKVGKWSLIGGKAMLELAAEEKTKNVLYAFISNGTILYIGKTIQPLKRRMYGYQNPGPTQTTNIKNNGFIIETLSRGKPVEVYVLPDNGLLHFGGFHVNLAAGLEDSLVSTIKPLWNATGKGS